MCFNQIKRGVIKIINFKNIPTYLLTLALVVFFSTSTANANEEPRDLGSSDVSKVKVLITNDETGEITELNPLDPNNGVEIDKIESDNKGSTVEGYDVFIPVEESNPSGITSYISSGGNKTSGGVTAKLNVNYDVSSNGEKIKLNKVYGSWKPSSSMYIVTSRSVTAHSGTFHGKKIQKTHQATATLTLLDGDIISLRSVKLVQEHGVVLKLR